MKKTFTTLLLTMSLCVSMKAQVQVYEPFNSPFNPAASGWDIQNQSSSIGSNATGWYQGNSGATFSTVVGNPDDYFAADMNATSNAGATNTISCWLITPTLTLVNGGFLQFTTRNFNLPMAKADRIQVYYSVGTGTNVGTGPGTATNTAGTFTTLIYEMNANMQPNGYFANWWVITTSLTGIPTPTVGRLAFRYYVPNGGASAPNGNYIGIDEVRYSTPCARPTHFGDQNVPNAPFCAGLPLQLGTTNVTPAIPITSYTWFTGATTPTISYTLPNPGIKYIWSLSESTPGCVHLDISIISAVANPTVTYTITPGNSLCAGKSVTVAASGANNYTYTLGANTAYTFNPITLNTPTTITGPTAVQFTLTGRAAGNCTHRQVLTLTVNPTPTLTVAQSKSVSCTNSSVTFTASGASTYTWNSGITSTANPITYSTGTTAGVRNYTVMATSAAGCTSTAVMRTVTVSLCTGINESESDVSAVFYPNPFNEQLNVTNFSGQLSIYNQIGQLLMELTVNQQQTINTSDLPPGLYLIKTLSTTGEEKDYKIVKN